MSITPSGRPAWDRTNDHTAYGGHLNKKNFLAQDAVDPRTDVTAQNICRMAEDLACAAKMAPFAKVYVQANDASPADPTVLAYRAMAAASMPTVARVSDGVFTLTWADSYDDAYGVSADVDFKFVSPRAAASSIFATAALSDSTGNGKNNRVTVYVWDEDGNASLDAIVSVEVD